MVVAATGDDEDNLVISLLAKQEFAVPRVVARVNHPKNEWLFNENWGVDVSVSTPHLITRADRGGGVGRHAWSASCSWRRAGPAWSRSPWPTTRRSIGTDHPGARACPATPPSWPSSGRSHVVVPRGDTVFQAGDEVIALVTPDSEDEIRRMLTGK